MSISEARVSQIRDLDTLNEYLKVHKANFHRTPLTLQVLPEVLVKIQNQLKAIPLGNTEGHNRGWNYSTAPYVDVKEFRTIQNLQAEMGQPTKRGIVWDARPTPWTISEGWVRPLYLPRAEDLSSYLKHHWILFGWAPAVVSLQPDSFDSLANKVGLSNQKRESGLNFKRISQGMIEFDEVTIYRSIKGPKGLLTLISCEDESNPIYRG